MSAWALREEESVSPDDRSTRTSGVNGRLDRTRQEFVLAHGEQIKVVMRTSALTVMVTLLRKHTRGQNMKGVDGYEVRMQEMEARVNTLSHGQSTKDFLLDVIRACPVLQRSGLSETVTERYVRTSKEKQTSGLEMHQNETDSSQEPRQRESCKVEDMVRRRCIIVLKN